MPSNRRMFFFVAAVLWIGTSGFSLLPSVVSTISRISFSDHPDQNVYLVRFSSDTQVDYYDLQQGPGKIKLTIFGALMAEDAVRDFPGGPIRVYTIQRLPDRVTIRFDMFDRFPVAARVQHDPGSADLLLTLTYVDSPVVQRIANRPSEYSRTGILQILDGQNMPPSTFSASQAGRGNRRADIDQDHRVFSTSTAQSLLPTDPDGVLEQWEVDSPPEVELMIQEAEGLGKQVLLATGSERWEAERRLDAKLIDIFEMEQQLWIRSMESSAVVSLTERSNYAKRERDKHRIFVFRKSFLLGQAAGFNMDNPPMSARYWGRKGRASVDHGAISRGSRTGQITARPRSVYRPQW